MDRSGKKLVKILDILGVVLLGVNILIVVMTISAIDTIAGTAIKQGGSCATGVETTVSSVDVGDIAGRLGAEADEALKDAAAGIEEGLNDLFGGGAKDKK